jgi:hypothetical protein
MALGGQVNGHYWQALRDATVGRRALATSLSVPRRLANDNRVSMALPSPNQTRWSAGRIRRRVRLRFHTIL